MLSKQTKQIVKNGIEAAKVGNFGQTPDFVKDSCSMKLNQQTLLECEVESLNYGECFCTRLDKPPYMKLKNGNSLNLMTLEEVSISGTVYPVEVELKTTPMFVRVR